MDEYSSKVNFINEQEADERDPNTIDWVEEETGVSHNHLSPVKHPQRDLFIADLFDALSLQLDQASMEYPLFALKAGDTKPRYYEQKGFKVKVDPNSLGIATIHDKDVWIYSISKLAQAMRDGKPIDRTIHFTIYDYLKTTNRAINGTTYERAKDSLDRLSSTRITTEIETDKIKEARGFGLVESWRVVEEKDGRMVRVSVTLPEWLYRSVTSKNLLTLSPDYFRIRKPLDRRVYELARKHCGNGKEWKFDLKTLHERTGSTASIREFKRAIKSLAESDQLPDYHVLLIEKHLRTDVKKDDDQVMLINRNYQPTKVAQSKNKYITEAEFIALGSDGSDAYQIAIKAFIQGYQIPKELQKKYGIEGDKFLQARAAASKITDASKSEKKPVLNQLILDNMLIANIKNNIVKSVGIGLTEEDKKPLFKIEISEHYQNISKNNVVIDANGDAVSEMTFKTAMYKAFNFAN